jgi:hypothetical protein
MVDVFDRITAANDEVFQPTLLLELEGSGSAIIDTWMRDSYADKKTTEAKLQQAREDAVKLNKFADVIAAVRKGM